MDNIPYTPGNLLSIGLDHAVVARFVPWQEKDSSQLRKFFTQSEIDYCLHTDHIPTRAQRLAGRFAAREGCFKAYHALMHYRGMAHKALALLPLQQHITIDRTPAGMPICTIDWPTVGITDMQPIIHLSITHTAELATALVMITN